MLPHQWLKSTHSHAGYHDPILLELSCYRIGNMPFFYIICFVFSLAIAKFLVFILSVIVT